MLPPDLHFPGVFSLVIGHVLGIALYCPRYLSLSLLARKWHLFTNPFLILPVPSSQDWTSLLPHFHRALRISYPWVSNLAAQGITGGDLK